MEINQNTILIVEDEAAVRKALRERLQREGYTILEARNGQEGLTLAQGEHPDLILLDIVMPVLDGISMIEKLRRDHWGKEARVIVLSNLTDADMENRAHAAGIPDYLIKSDWTLEDVVHKVKSMLGQ